MTILGTPSVYLQCPPCLAEKIHELNYERNESGIETTPDETSEVIESLFEHIGRLWMAELWHVIETGTLTIQDCDGILLAIIDNLQRRSLTTGSWVSFSRQITTIFKQHQLSSFVEGLDTIDWGRPADNGLIARIIDFRNRFAHGSFEAPVDLINAGYNDVNALIQQVPGLWKQQWHVLTTVGWKTITENGLQDSVYTSENNGSDIVIEKEGAFMSLTPFFAHTDDGATIHLPMWKPITVTEGLQQEQITVWHQKYRKEYAGLINRADSIKSRWSDVSAISLKRFIDPRTPGAIPVGANPEDYAKPTSEGDINILRKIRDLDQQIEMAAKRMTKALLAGEPPAEYVDKINGMYKRRYELLSQISMKNISKEVWQDIVTPLLKPSRETTLLVGHPGTGVSNILPSILRHSQQDTSDTQWMFWDVRPFDLTQSANCFVRALAETLQSGIFTDKDGNETKRYKDLKELSKQIDSLGTLLRDSNLLIVIDGLQYAHLSYRFEPHTMIDVCNWLTELNASLVLIHHPAENKTPIFFTSQINWPIHNIINQKDLDNAYKWLQVEKTPLYQNVLNTLHDKPNSSLFEICDALDAANPKGPRAFEPEIEYALWHLRPLLATKTEVVQIEGPNQRSTPESIRTWSTFSNEVTQ